MVITWRSWGALLFGTRHMLLGSKVVNKPVAKLWKNQSKPFSMSRINTQFWDKRTYLKIGCTSKSLVHSRRERRIHWHARKEEGQALRCALETELLVLGLCKRLVLYSKDFLKEELNITRGAKLWG